MPQNPLISGQIEIAGYPTQCMPQGVSFLFHWHKRKMDRVGGESHVAVVDNILEPDRPIPSVLFGLSGMEHSTNICHISEWMDASPLK